MSNLENQENIVNDTTENSDKIIESTESMQDTTKVVKATDVPINQETEGRAEENKSYVGYTREELVNELQELLKKTESAVINDIKGSVEAIKQTFYRLQKEKENPLSSEDGEDTVVERVMDDIGGSHGGAARGGADRALYVMDAAEQEHWSRVLGLGESPHQVGRR